MKSKVLYRWRSGSVVARVFTSPSTLRWGRGRTQSVRVRGSDLPARCRCSQTREGFAPSPAAKRGDLSPNIRWGRGGRPEPKQDAYHLYSNPGSVALAGVTGVTVGIGACVGFTTCGVS